MIAELRMCGLFCENTTPSSEKNPVIGGNYKRLEVIFDNGNLRRIYSPKASEAQDGPSPKEATTGCCVSPQGETSVDPIDNYAPRLYP